MRFRRSQSGGGGPAEGPGQEQVVRPRVFHPSRVGFGPVPRPPEDVAPDRTSNGAARILGDEQSAQGPPISPGPAFRGGVGVEPERDAERDEPPVHGQRSEGRQRDALRPNGAVAFDFPEKDVGPILFQKGASLFRMAFHPGPDGLECDALAREGAHADQFPPDGAVGVAVLAVIADLQEGSVFQDHPARALDVKKEGGDGIVHPDDLESPPFQGAGVDARSVVVRPELAPFDLADDPPPPQVPLELAQVGRDQVFRPVVKRVEVRPAARAGAAEDRLVVSGEQPLRFTVVGRPVGDERFLEKGPRARIVPRAGVLQPGRFG